MSERDISVELTEEVKKWIAREGFDPAYGARPLRRTIQRQIENPLSKKILEGEFNDHDNILVEIADDSLIFTKNGK